METSTFSQFNLSSFIDLAIHFGIKIVIAILILIVGFWLTKKITNSFRNIMSKRDADASLQSFLSSLINMFLKVVVIIIVLSTVGIQTTSIVAIIGAASLAIGMALSGTLQNFAGGVMILLFKPFRVGDSIDAGGQSGTVQDIQIFNTILKTADNKVIYMPNGGLSNGVIVNNNQEGIRRGDCIFKIPYGDDVNKAKEILLNIAKMDERVHKNPAPSVNVSNLGDSSINLQLLFWANSGDIASLQVDFNERVYNNLKK